jgi:hypothetical protein
LENTEQYMASTAQFDQRQNGAGSSAPAAADRPRFATRHYSVPEIAELWNLSDDAVRKIFEKEPGVLVIGDPKSSGRKRRYATLRIPEDVVARVHLRMTKV